jgi:SPP1 gp7 family putative phage head morphogenesis protein
MLRRLVGDRLEEIVRSEILPRLPSLVAEARGKRPTGAASAMIRVDAWPEEVFALRDLMRIGLEDTPELAAQRAEDISVDVSNQNRNQWAAIMRSTVGVEVISGEPWLRDQANSFVSQNASLITKLSEDAIADIEGTMQRGLSSGLRVEEMRKQILERVEVSKKKAQFIARDQVASFNGQLTRLRQEDLGISRYVWRTSRDERVRGRPAGLYPKAKPSHWVMEGKLCSWENATIYYDADGNVRKRSSIGGPNKHPGEDFNCRCTAEAHIEDVLAQTEL